jgi:hypothetical protein
LIEILEQVINMLDPNAEAQEIRCDASRTLLCFIELLVRGKRRLNDE